MNTDNLLHTIYRNGKMFQCSSVNAKTILCEGNCYYIMNTGSIAHPFYIGRDIDTRKEFTIGDNFDLVDFIVKCDKKKTFVLVGINRHMGYIILALVEQKREKLNKKKAEVKKQDVDGGRRKIYYDADNLIVAKFARVIDDDGNREITEQKYIFEKYICDDRDKYREVFTGMLFDLKKFTKNLPCVIEPQLFTDYFPLSKNNKIEKLDLIFFLNEINCLKKRKFLSRVRRNKILF